MSSKVYDTYDLHNSIDTMKYIHFIEQYITNEYEKHVVIRVPGNLPPETLVAY